jgi:hypothetical protein
MMMMMKIVIHHSTVLVEAMVGNARPHQSASGAAVATRAVTTVAHIFLSDSLAAMAVLGRVM